MSKNQHQSLHILCLAEAYFDRNQPQLAMALLVAAEQTIPNIEDPQLFLRAQCHADRLWRDYLIQTKSKEFDVACENAQVNQVHSE